VRRAIADVATSRKRLELQIAELERQADTGQDAAGQLTQLRRRYAAMQAQEERVTAASRRLMAEINAFKTGAEATKTAYTAAEEAAEAVGHR
jgi:phage shock protein A